MVAAPLSSVVPGALFASLSLLSACQGSEAPPYPASALGQPELLPLDSTVILDMEEWVGGKSRTLMLTGVTERQYGAPHYYFDAEVSVQPGWMVVSVNGIRYQESDIDAIQGGAAFGIPLDKLLTTGTTPSLGSSQFRLDFRYGDRVDTYAARITSDTVTVASVQSAGLSEVRTPTWKRTPDDLLWYYAIQFSSSSGYQGEVSPVVVQPLSDYVTSAGALPWALPAGYYKSLELRVDDQGVGMFTNVANPTEPPHRAYTFQYSGDTAALANQLSQFQFPAPLPWIYYLNPL
jgi:hypothetical protein